jgi:hypothetical protein
MQILAAGRDGIHYTIFGNRETSELKGFKEKCA